METIRRMVQVWDFGFGSRTFRFQFGFFEQVSALFRENLNSKSGFFFGTSKMAVIHFMVCSLVPVGIRFHNPETPYQSYSTFRVSRVPLIVTLVLTLDKIMLKT